MVTSTMVMAADTGRGEKDDFYKKYGSPEEAKTAAINFRPRSFLGTGIRDL